MGKKIGKMENEKKGKSAKNGEKRWRKVPALPEQIMGRKGG